MSDWARAHHSPGRAWGKTAVRGADNRNQWRGLLKDVGELARRIVLADGERSPVPIDLRHQLAGLERLTFQVEGAAAQAMAAAFRLQASALIDATIPRRRVAIALGLAGSVEALNTLMDDQQLREAAVWRGRSGGDC